MTKTKFIDPPNLAFESICYKLNFFSMAINQDEIDITKNNEINSSSL